MNKLIWYGLACVASILLGILFYFGYKYYQLKNIPPTVITRDNATINGPNVQNETPIKIKGKLFCLDERCVPGFRTLSGKEYLLSIRNVKDPEVLEGYMEDSSKVEITGTLNTIDTRMIAGKEYEVLTINNYEKI